MANTFKSNLRANLVTTGNTVYTCPSGTQSTLIGLSLANKSSGTVTANAYITRSSVDYALITLGPILSGSTLVVVGAEQKVVLEANDILKVVASANGSVDCVASLLEIT